MLIDRNYLSLAQTMTLRWFCPMYEYIPANHPSGSDPGQFPVPQPPGFAATCTKTSGAQANARRLSATGVELPVLTRRMEQWNQSTGGWLVLVRLVRHWLAEGRGFCQQNPGGSALVFEVPQKKMWPAIVLPCKPSLLRVKINQENGESAFFLLLFFTQGQV